MWKHKIDFQTAKNLVKKKRKIISLNHGFEQQLQKFDIKQIEM